MKFSQTKRDDYITQINFNPGPGYYNIADSNKPRKSLQRRNFRETFGGVTNNNNN